MTPEATDDEEFRQVENSRITRHARAARNQRESGEPLIRADHEREAVGFAPVRVETIVTEAPVFTRGGPEDLAEVVHIQLEKVLEPLPIRALSRDQLDLHRDSGFKILCPTNLCKLGPAIVRPRDRARNRAGGCEVFDHQYEHEDLSGRAEAVASFFKSDSLASTSPFRYGCLIVATTADRPDWGIPPWRVDYHPSGAPVPAACDVAVIGGGFTGLSAAYHLARAAQQVVVFEATSFGAGASGRTGGIALEGTAAGPEVDADRCLESLDQVVQECRIDCALRLPGCWELAHRRSRSAGPILWPDGDNALCIEDTVPGGVIDPGGMVAGLARAAETHGARLCVPATVQAIELGDVVTLDVAGSRVRARAVVVALNAYTGKLLDLPVTFHPALTLALCTSALADGTLREIGLGDDLPFYTVDLPYLWGRRMVDGRIMFGAGLVFPPEGDVARVGLDHPEAVGAFARLEHRIRGFHPALAEIRFTAHWGGPIAFLERRTPIISRHPKCPGLIVTGAYAGHGVALSVHVGRLVADAITTGRPLPTWAAL